MHESRKQLVVGLDGLRIFAAGFVMLYHLTYFVSVPGHTPFRLTHGQLHFPEFVPITQYGWIGVEIFFLISGFVISMSAENATAGRFASGRFLRLVPTVWICAPITFAAAFLAADGSLSDLAARLVRSLLFIPIGAAIDGSYWTLGIEIAFYVGIFCVIRLGAWRRVHWLLYAMAVVSLGFNAARLWGPLPHGYQNRILDLLLLSYGCFFALGALIYKIRADGPSAPRTGFAVMALAASVLGIISQSRMADAHATGLIPCAIFLCALVVFGLSVAYNDGINRALGHWAGPIRRIGVATYPLYLLHQLLGCAILAALTTAGLAPRLALALTVAAVFLFVFAVTQIEPHLRKAMKAGIERLDNQVRLIRKQPSDIL